jgi:hypothetical protein
MSFIGWIASCWSIWVLCDNFLRFVLAELKAGLVEVIEVIEVILWYLLDDDLESVK